MSNTISDNWELSVNKGDKAFGSYEIHLYQSKLNCYAIMNKDIIKKTFKSDGKILFNQEVWDKNCKAGRNG